MTATVPTWPVQDAKARFSEFLTACLTQGPQVVTKHGTETAVLVALHEWQRLQQSRPPSLKQLLLQAPPQDSLPARARSQARRRAIPAWK